MPERTTSPRIRTALVPVLLVLLGLELMVRFTQSTWERYSPDDYVARVCGCRSMQPDLLLLGGSPVSEGCVPAEFVGLTWQGVPLERAYCMGLSGGTTSEFAHAVQRACDTPPRVIVYGITASDINDSRNEPHGPASLLTLGDTLRWAKQRPDSRKWVLRHYALARLNRVSALVHHRHGLRMAAALHAEKWFGNVAPVSCREAHELRETAARLYEGDGYAPAAGFVNRSYEFTKTHGLSLPPFQFLRRYRTGAHLQSLEFLIDWCERRQVTLVLVDMPVTADLEQQYPTVFAEYRQRLAEVVSRRSVPLVNAHRDIVGITDAGFADTIHLNGVGAKVFSRWLKSRLQEQGEATQPAGDRVRAQVEEPR